MLETLLHVFNTPHLWLTLGIVTSLSMFISPVLYNGDYKVAFKSIFVISGYMFFVGLLNVFHLTAANHGTKIWVQPILMLLLVGVAYTGGLTLGVWIHNLVHKKHK